MKVMIQKSTKKLPDIRQSPSNK